MLDLFGSQGTVQPGPSIWEKNQSKFVFWTSLIEWPWFVEAWCKCRSQKCQCVEVRIQWHRCLGWPEDSPPDEKSKVLPSWTNLMVNRDLYVVFGRHVYSSPGRLDCIWNWTRTPIEECRLNNWVSILHLIWNIMERRLKIVSGTTGYWN